MGDVPVLRLSHFTVPCEVDCYEEPKEGDGARADRSQTSGLLVTGPLSQKPETRERASSY